MTLDELAAAVERAPSQLSMIETGKREPKLTLLRAIAKALGATVDQLLEAEPSTSAPRSRSRSSAP
jgi:transcriptional regulator with XRE-family HTH domain